MSDRTTGSLTVDQVLTRFGQWRQDRPGKARIPDELWTAAMEVARREGVNRTAAVLHLDGGKLKRRMVAANMVSERAMPPAFVELFAPQTGAVPEYTVELEGRRAKLRIHLKGATASDLTSLSRTLWDAAAS